VVHVVKAEVALCIDSLILSLSPVLKEVTLGIGCGKWTASLLISQVQLQVQIETLVQLHRLFHNHLPNDDLEVLALNSS
jgi:hypothetical protein